MFCWLDGAPSESNAQQRLHDFGRWHVVNGVQAQLMVLRGSPGKHHCLHRRVGHPQGPVEAQHTHWAGAICQATFGWLIQGDSHGHCCCLPLLLVLLVLADYHAMSLHMWVAKDIEQLSLLHDARLPFP